MDIITYLYCAFAKVKMTFKGQTDFNKHSKNNSELFMKKQCFNS